MQLSWTKVRLVATLPGVILVIVINTCVINKIISDRPEILLSFDGSETSSLKIKNDEQNQLKVVQDKIPYFILHVGPKKSGTTTIQSDFQSPYLEKLLLEDDYMVIPEKIMHRRKWKFYEPTETLDNNMYTFHKEFNDVVGIVRNSTGYNIFGSSEYLDSLNYGECKAWKDNVMYTSGDDPDGEYVKFGEKKWNLQVIITYRRLHSSLPSFWNQYYRHTRGKTGGIKHKSMHVEWPGINGDIRIPSFEEWLTNIRNGGKDEMSYPSLAQSTYNEWKNCSNGITVVNIHELNVQGVERNLTTNLICKALKGARNSCNSLLTGNVTIDKSLTLPSSGMKEESKIKNKSVNLDYDILAVYAYESGLLGRTRNETEGARKYKRPYIIEMIRDQVESKGFILPKKCPNATILEYIYNWSLENEKWVNSVIRNQERDWSSDFATALNTHNTSHEGKIEIQELSAEQLVNFDYDWKESLAMKIFCTVDVVETLHQKEWKSFFQNHTIVG